MGSNSTIDTSEAKRIGHLLERTTRVAKLSFVKLFDDLKADVTPEQWVMLDRLDEQGSMTQKQLGEASFKNAPTISRIIDNLVRKCYVHREPDEVDGRKMNIKLTNEGKSIVRRCRPKITALRKSSWKGLSEEDYNEFVRIIETVFSNFLNESDREINDVI